MLKNIIIGSIILSACASEKKYEPTSSVWESVVKVSSEAGICSGTIVGKRHVLTAAHCRVKPGDYIQTYTTTELQDPATNIVVRVWSPNGMDRADMIRSNLSEYVSEFPVWIPQKYVINGKLQDILLLETRNDLNAGQPLDISDEQPNGEDVLYHIGIGNQNYVIRQSEQIIENSHKDKGFLTGRENNTSPGDSGGPLYNCNKKGWYKISGVSHGEVYNVWRFKLLDLFSSVAPIAKDLRREASSIYPINDNWFMFSASLTDHEMVYSGVCMASSTDGWLEVGTLNQNKECVLNNEGFVERQKPLFMLYKGQFQDENKIYAGYVIDSQTTICHAHTVYSRLEVSGNLFDVKTADGFGYVRNGICNYTQNGVAYRSPI